MDVRRGTVRALRHFDNLNLHHAISPDQRNVNFACSHRHAAVSDAGTFPCPDLFLDFSNSFHVKLGESIFENVVSCQFATLDEVCRDLAESSLIFGF